MDYATTHNTWPQYVYLNHCNVLYGCLNTVPVCAVSVQMWHIGLDHRWI